MVKRPILEMRGSVMVACQLHRPKAESSILSSATKKEKQAFYQAQHYKKHKAVYIERSRVHNLKIRKQQREYVEAYKASHHCVDCGESDPIVLEFDHRDRSTKLFCIAEIKNSHRCGMKRLITEIEKCDVRCANCHRRKTHREIFG